MAEIKKALLDMDTNSAPGPNGLPVGFYREFWHEIKDIFLEMFIMRHREELNPCRLNYGLITLVLKLKEANNIKQYRPICLLNVDYIWFTKVVTTRLTSVDEKLVNEKQYAFMPKRYILEGVVILHEVLHELRVSKKEGVILKLDFEKVYEKVHWGFMMEVLARKNFPLKWIQWMQ